MAQGPYNNQLPPHPLYETSYLGFSLKVFSDHIEFKGNRGQASLSLLQIADVRVAGPFVGQVIVVMTDGTQHRIATDKKQEAAQAIMQARAHFLSSSMPNVPSVPTGVPIDNEIQRVKLAIEQVRLELRQVNASMASTRARYQQRHMHGGGKVGGIIRAFEQGSKDGKLRKQQPVKEQLQQQKLALEQELNQLKMLKAQGTTHIIKS